MPATRHTIVQTLMLIGLAVLGFALISSLWWQSMSPTFSTAAAGVGASLVAAVVFDVVPRIVRWSESWGVRSRATRFFGPDFATRSARLVAAHYKAGNSVQAIALVDATDMRGLVDIARELTTLFNQPLDIGSDADKPPDHGVSFITFGLGTNAYAKMICDCCDDEFITWFSRNKHDGHVGLATNDGRMEMYNGTSEVDFGLIVRVVPRHQSDKVWILCGGAGNEGTAGAGWYLATHWQDLLNAWTKQGSTLGVRSFDAALVRVKPKELRSAELVRTITRTLDKVGSS